ncbi:hypothetical protein SARI_01408 [Salmonella enterica subsp. arizonae serovar 62:z4,z23:-]|uniref:Uncharacterized protein n=1 Tax=Salmonella arizonae (strain ATCC BAA-731 / CDC346-86 / RSK2980) TaxID=41514 RepID=A9MR09_SALAR|nr:hypothetical protein SARI_01408 [Salmonella enterica subsp. arizonae serovar 62:z4,z23:-]
MPDLSYELSFLFSCLLKKQSIDHSTNPGWPADRGGMLPFICSSDIEK